jgi:hypothetical protein
MKRLFFLAFLLTTIISFAQSNGTINGTLLDVESNNEPLMLANVSIKETGEKTRTNENGVFKFENLNQGHYTLACSFVGYETKEIEINVTSGNTSQIKLGLNASTISLDDLVLAIASTDKEITTTTEQ